MESKDTHDPGWNDPPIFSYDKATAIQAAAANKKGISLNKRVPFPISGDKQKNVQPNTPVEGDLGRIPSNLQLPPPPLIPSSITSITKSEVPKQPDEKINTKEKLGEVLKNLGVSSSDEITKRIKIMEKMWIDDKLDDIVKLKMIELSEALAKNDYSTVDYIQKALMVDYVSQCSSWMSGIRHLINEKKSDKLTVSDESSTNS